MGRTTYMTSRRRGAKYEAFGEKGEEIIGSAAKSVAAVGVDRDEGRPLAHVDGDRRSTRTPQLDRWPHGLGVGIGASEGGGEHGQGGDVDEQAQLDAVAGHERQLLEHLTATGVLAAEGLDDVGEVGEQQRED